MSPPKRHRRQAPAVEALPKTDGPSVPAKVKTEAVECVAAGVPGTAGLVDGKMVMFYSERACALA
jgi:hypothetical protein